MTNLFNADFIEYIDLLNKHKVDYVLVGGMAVNLHGYRRSTGDMDLFVNPTEESHNKFKKVHAAFGMHMGEMGDLTNFLDTNKYDVFTFGISPTQIDLMTVCKGITFEEAYTASVFFDLDDNVQVSVIDYRELIISKRAAGRHRDKADVEELEKVRKKSKN